MELKDLTEEIIFIFIFAVEYKVNFYYLIKLYRLSKELFSGYLHVLAPALRFSQRRLMQYKRQAQRVRKALKDGLTLEKEMDVKILDYIKYYVKNIFFNNKKYITLVDLNEMDKIVCVMDGGICSKSKKEFLNVLHKVTHILIDDQYYVKSNFINFIRNISPDLITKSDLYGLNVTELHDKLTGVEINNGI